VKTVIYSTEQAVVVRLLRRMRKEAGLTQEQLAKKLGVHQSFIAKCEGGERRVDIVKLRVFCSALGTSLAEFVEVFEKEICSSLGRGWPRTREAVTRGHMRVR
jgi:transcriptional regulator with XRE-family HTH domain